MGRLTADVAQLASLVRDSAGMGERASARWIAGRMRQAGASEVAVESYRGHATFAWISALHALGGLPAGRLPRWLSWPVAGGPLASLECGSPGTAPQRMACSGPVALSKRKLIHWLLTHGFEELPRRATSHRRFRGPGTTITVPAHGRLELSAKHTGMLVRELEKAGFDRDEVREELGL